MRRTVCLVLLLLSTAPALAQGRVKLAREAAELLIAKFGSKVGSVGGLTARIETLAARHGDEAIAALRKGGPGALELVEQSGVNAGKAIRALGAHGVQAEVRILARPVAMRQFVQFGDDAALALVKHPGIAEPLIEKGGASAVKALAQVEAQSGRRLAMLAEGEMAKHPEMFGVAARHGERAVKFMWENKVALAGTAAAAAFIANPEPFLDGTSKLVTATGDAVVKPVVQEIVKPVVQEAAGVVSTVLYALLGLGALIASVAVYLGVKHPKVLATAGKMGLHGLKRAMKK